MAGRAEKHAQAGASGYFGAQRRNGSVWRGVMDCGSTSAISPRRLSSRCTNTTHSTVRAGSGSRSCCGTAKMPRCASAGSSKPCHRTSGSLCLEDAGGGWGHDASTENAETVQPSTLNGCAFAVLTVRKAAGSGPSLCVEQTVAKCSILYPSGFPALTGRWSAC